MSGQDGNSDLEERQFVDSTRWSIASRSSHSEQNVRCGNPTQCLTCHTPLLLSPTTKLLTHAHTQDDTSLLELWSSWVWFICALHALHLLSYEVMVVRSTAHTAHFRDRLEAEGHTSIISKAARSVRPRSDTSLEIS
eukprot:5715669-Amphidinium_carterae.1